MGFDRFLNGLCEREIKQVVKLVHPRNLNETLIQVLDCEVVKQSMTGQACVPAFTVEPSEKPYSVEELVQKVIGALKTRQKERSCTAGTVENWTPTE